MDPTQGNRFGRESLSESSSGSDADATRDLGGSGPAARADDAREQRLMSAVREYTDAVESGRRPNPREWVARYPDIARDLSACLEGLAFVNGAAAEMGGACGPSGALPGAAEAGAAGGAGAQAATQALGDFRLIREIGRGGMGVVYEAVQLSLGRRVAVKVLPLASALDSRQLQRFRNEAQAAAQLHHTNIVPVYAVGCERSVHFYAMQLIEGQSLADLIREMRQLSGRSAAAGNNAVRVADRPTDGGPGRDSAGDYGLPDSRALAAEAAPGRRPVPGSASGSAPDSGARVGSASHGGSPRPAPAAGPSGGPRSQPAMSLSSLRSAKGSAYFRAVARLGLQAAEALDYAHRAGVVHRDVKPANLLLDEQGTLWVTDFGLAQFYTENNLTQTGDLLGTLRYMSPEQASGRAVVLDQRTDVYSLGVTLYELLTLERALPGETREQLLAQLGACDPRPARTVNRAIPVELETILIKATAKEPADRYASAAALAEDLRRFLQDEPILARPPSAWDQTVKWTRRHRSLALAGLVMLALATVGFFTSTVLIAREQARTHAAYNGEFHKALEAAKQRAAAERSFGQARDLVNFLSRVAADELAGSPESAEVRKEMLEAALDYYQGFLADHPGDARFDAQMQEAQASVMKILAELSAFEDFDRVDTSARLLSEPSVRTALKLSAEQITRARRVRADVRRGSFPGEADDGGGDGPGGGGPGGDGPGDGGPGRDGPGAGPPGGRDGPPEFRDMTEEEKQKKFTASASHLDEELKKLLAPQQFERLRQITRQVRGPAAFSDSDVADALALTREQKEAVRRAQADYRIASRKPHGPHGPDGPGDDPADDDVGDARPTRQADAVRLILAQLTPSQRNTWNRLAGEPFAGALTQHFGPGGPGGPGHDGPGHDGGGHGGPGHDGPGHDGRGEGGPGYDEPGQGGPGRGGRGHDGREPGGPGQDRDGDGGPGHDGPGPGSEPPDDPGRGVPGGEPGRSGR